MKLLALAAIFVAVASGRLSSPKPNDNHTQSPWQAGKLYRYDVEAHTLARLHEGTSSGTAFKARFTVRAKAPGQLQAKLENAQRAQVHEVLSRDQENELPKDLKYQPVQDLDKPFEIFIQGGRVQSLSLPSSLSLAHENLLKGLISALQVDLSAHRNVHSHHDTYDKQIQQGLFRKMETDVTGDCETLYTVSPIASEWRRELPKFSAEQEPIEITKSKNYGHCHHRVDYHFGVPEYVEWTGTAHKSKEEQFIKRATVSRILVAKQGPIYKAETTSTVQVHPHMFGKQQAEVHSKVTLNLVAHEQDQEAEWEKPEGNREIQNLLYSMSSKPVTIDDRSSSSSSSSFESQENRDNQENEQHSRIRRSARPKTIVAVNKVIVKRSKDHSSSSSSSSSSSDSSSAYVNDEIPKQNEPAYAALYMNPQPHADRKQNPANAQKLVQEIAQQLQNPNNMPKADLLSKFNILVRVIASMSTGQLSQTSRSIEIAKSSNNIVKADMWMVYRDAVTQAGTYPAFQQIKTWIENKKIEGNEAAEVVSTLVSTLRYPTKELMSQFFKLATSPEVREQNNLNTTALISATKFINMGQVNNDTAHSFYPTHMYGRLSRRHDRFVLEEILPRLRQDLDKAIQDKDSHKAQVYIKAIGHLGHRAILDVYTPYLEGKIEVSTYLRTQMVRSLATLAHQQDGYVRAVLYSILRNTAEPYEVRVAAIQKIFAIPPTSPMMQAMAQMTHNDPSLQVRAALKFSIEEAAKLKNPRYLRLARAAQAVKGMLTTENFGTQQSVNTAMEFNDNFDNEEKDSTLNIRTQIGSEDNFFPKSMSYEWERKANGWYRKDMISASFSSVQRFVDLFKKSLIEDYQRPETESNHKYSANKIAQMLNIKRNKPDQLEAAFDVKFMDIERYHTYGEDDLQQLTQGIKQYLTELENGVDKHYTKVTNEVQVSIMFPVAMGMPFIYKYKEPTVAHIRSKAKGPIKFGNGKNSFSASMDKEVQFTYAKNYDGSVGFLDTLENQYASAGLIKKTQFNIAFKAAMQMKDGEINVNLRQLEPEQDNTVLHYSVWPYTANQNKDSLVPVSQDHSTKLVTRPNKVVSLDTKFGQQIGAPFHLQGYSYSEDYRGIDNVLQPRDLFSRISQVMNQKDNAQTHFNLKYLGKQSKNKGVTLHAVYDTYYNQKQDGQMDLTASNVKDMSPNSESRRDELAKRVAAGVNTARVRVFDLSATFDLPQKLDYVFTYAMASSPVDPKIQHAFFGARNSAQYGNSQINAVAAFRKPESISPLDFQEALKKDLKVTFEADIRYGQNNKEHIHVQGQAERSKKYAEELQNHPRGKQCAQEIAEGNQYQHACHKMIVMAHAYDNMKASINYKDINPVTKNMFYQAYRFAEHYGFWQTDVNSQKVSPDGKLEIAAEASYFTNTLNLVMNSRNGETRSKGVSIPRATSRALSAYWPFKAEDRVFNYYTKHQFQPYCSVDGTRIRTFSNRSYEYPLSRSWHVVMHDPKKQGQNDEELVILARRPNEKQQEIYMSYRSKSGKDLEIQIQPAADGSKQFNMKVNTKAKKISEGDLTTYWDDDEEKPILEYYTQDGVLVVDISDDYLRAMYDGQRFVVQNKQSRNRNRGICGRMTSDPRDDYLTPNGLVDKPEHYGASYALNDENSEPKTEELQSQAKQAAYQPENHYTAILRSDDDWKNAMQSSESSSEEGWSSKNVYRSRSYNKERGSCQLEQQVQYYENHGEICITTSALPACSSRCKGDGYKEQAAQVVCRPKLDQQFRAYRDQIRQGQNPQVSGVPQARQYRVPMSCQA